MLRVLPKLLLLYTSFLGAGAAVTGLVNAASITWAAPFNITTANQIDLTGVLVEARNATADGLAPVVEIGGEILFFEPIEFGIPVTPTSGFFTDFGGDTGSHDLNLVFNSHTWLPGMSPWSFTLVGLTQGKMYQLQIIAGADLRGPLALRTQRAGDGALFESISAPFSRGGVGSVIGTFTADSPVQVIRIHSGGDGSVDPAISGYVLRELSLPTPPSDIELSHDETTAHTPAGELLAFLSALDVNVEDTLAFELVDTQQFPDNAFFRIESGNRFVSNAALGHEGTVYEIRVRATDSSGLSAEETLTFRVTPLSTIDRIEVESSGALLRIPQRAGRRIGVEYTDNLRSGTWIELGNFIEDQNGFSEFIDPDSIRVARPTGFYRAFLRPLTAP